jgi:tyrosyl-tRNA synthetase
MLILEELKNRNILKNITSKEKFNKLKGHESVYIGFDPTANSLHLGNYIQITILKRFKKFGFKPIAVLGGATGMIGDPSGKLEERNLINEDKLNKNKYSIKKQLENFGFKVVDNYDYYKDMNVLSFFRNVGKNLNVNYMISKEIISSRLEKGISFTEFAYQLIQG